MQVADVPAPAAHPALPTAPLVLYDGTCGLCTKAVQWILRHERDHAILFAPLQGPTAALARARFPQIPVTLESVVYVADGRAHLRSKALLHATRHLNAPWRWASPLRVLPGFLLDLGYRVIAAIRYRLWGHADACQLATRAQRLRFLP
jgi:predicted DCC family thiol-disulfide oxidoreductase YuxK